MYQELGVQYPATLTSNDEIATSTDFVICPFDLYIGYKGTYRVQNFDLKLYSGSVETIEDINDDNLINTLTLNENSSYFNTENTYEDYPTFVIPISHIKLMLNNEQYSQYFTITYVSANGVIGIENEFYYDVENNTITGIVDNNVPSPPIDITETNNKIDDVNNSINNMQNSIIDSNIDNITDDTLPSDDTTDITREGVNGVFTSIYNAFCTGDAQDIVFPIPFTDKNITLQANYVNNMLSSNGASWVVTIIQAFWWYLISRFIIKDVMDKINKIKSGNIEDIETSNIRGDML